MKTVNYGFQKDDSLSSLDDISDTDSNEDSPNNSTPLSVYALGNLAIIRYPFKNKALKYLGRIQDVDGEELSVQLLKKMGEKTFSVKGDTDVVPLHFVFETITDGNFTLNNRRQYVLNEPHNVDLDM